MLPANPDLDVRASVKPGSNVRLDLLCWATGVLALLVLLPGAIRLVQILAEQPFQVDFAVFYQAAGRLLAGDQNLYRTWPGPIVASYPQPLSASDPFLYPPAAALIFAPFSLLPFQSAQTLWLVLNAAFTIGAVVLVGRGIGTDKRIIGLAVVFSVLFPPFQRTIHEGQVNCILLLLFAGSYIALRRDFGVVAGALLMVATLLKVYPVVLLAFYVWRGNRGVFLGAAITGLTMTAMAVALVGIQPHIDYFLFFLPRLVMNPPIADPLANSSITAVVGRWLAFLGPAGRIAGLTLAFGILGVTFWAVRRRRAGEFARSVDFSLLLSAVLLSSSISYDAYLLVLIVPFLIVTQAATTPPALRTKLFIILFSTIFCITFARYWRSGPEVLAPLIASFACIGNLIWWVGLARIRLLPRHAMH